MVKNKLEELMQVLHGVSVGLAYIVIQGNITATIIMVRHNNRRNNRTKLLQRKRAVN